MLDVYMNKKNKKLNVYERSEMVCPWDVATKINSRLERIDCWKHNVSFLEDMIISWIGGTMYSNNNDVLVYKFDLFSDRRKDRSPILLTLKGKLGFPW